MHNDRKIIEIWISRDEQQNTLLLESLKPIYAAYKELKFTVAVFLSGNLVLYECAHDLLIYNRRKQAENEVRREKTLRSVPDVG